MNFMVWPRSCLVLLFFRASTLPSSSSKVMNADVGTVSLSKSSKSLLTSSSCYRILSNFCVAMNLPLFWRAPIRAALLKEKTMSAITTLVIALSSRLVWRLWRGASPPSTISRKGLFDSSAVSSSSISRIRCYFKLRAGAILFS